MGTQQWMAGHLTVNDENILKWEHAKGYTIGTFTTSDQIVCVESRKIPGH